MWVTVEIGDLEYELEVTYFQPEVPARIWGPPGNDDPGSGAEIELGDEVKVHGLVEVQVGPGAFNSVPGIIDRITLDQFLELYSEYEGVAKEKALSHLEEKCIEDVNRQREEDYDDRDY